MNRKTRNGRNRHAPVRGKYAAAFKKGVDVVIHTEDGDKTHRVRRRPDGKFEWKHPRKSKSTA